MTIGDSLLAAIRDDPTDDLHRLIYADYLEETYPADSTEGWHASLIRLQVTGKGPSGQPGLWRHLYHWNGPVRPMANLFPTLHRPWVVSTEDEGRVHFHDGQGRPLATLTWRRGFLAEVEVSPGHWDCRFLPLTTTNPLEVVRLHGFAPRGFVSLRDAFWELAGPDRSEGSQALRPTIYHALTGGHERWDDYGGRRKFYSSPRDAEVALTVVLLDAIKAEGTRPRVVGPKVAQLPPMW